jgi:hypothetical protein
MNTALWVIVAVYAGLNIVLVLADWLGGDTAFMWVLTIPLMPGLLIVALLDRCGTRITKWRCSRYLRDSLRRKGSVY